MARVSDPSEAREPGSSSRREAARTDASTGLRAEAENEDESVEHMATVHRKRGAGGSNNRQ